MNQSWQNFKADLESIGEADLTHLQYEEMAAYVDGKCDDVEREIIDSHISICNFCADELRDLKEFSGTVIIPKNVEVALPAKVSFWQGVTSFWSPASKRFWIAGLSFAALLIIGISVVLISKHSKPDVALAPPLPNKSDNPPAAATGAPPTVSIPDQIVATLKDNSGEITLSQSGGLNGLENLSESERQIVKDALQTEKVSLPSDIKTLIGKAGTLMGEPDSGPAFKVLRPLGTVVQTDRPSFQWQKLEGSTIYTITIFDPNFNKVADSGPLQTTTWRSNVSLKSGATYLWQVTAVKDGKEITVPAAPAPEAKFRVVSRSVSEELNQIKQQSGSSHLVMGTFYAKNGLLDDAEKEFQALVAANPDSAVAKKLLSSVRGVRH
ncbi:MAG TPA: hypothetical protein VFC63_02855 [Blastocatellia bacterium]|nr:hypothetical protein [Blastocatellia bacterium]